MDDLKSTIGLISTRSDLSFNVIICYIRKLFALRLDLVIVFGVSTVLFVFVYCSSMGVAFNASYTVRMNMVSYGWIFVLAYRIWDCLTHGGEFSVQLLGWGKLIRQISPVTTSVFLFFTNFYSLLRGNQVWLIYVFYLRSSCIDRKSVV